MEYSTQKHVIFLAVTLNLELNFFKENGLVFCKDVCSVNGTLGHEHQLAE